MKHGVRRVWLDNMMDGWFRGMGIFQVYKVPARTRLSVMVTVSCTHTMNQYPVENYSTDPIRDLGEDVLMFVLLFREFEE